MGPFKWLVLSNTEGPKVKVRWVNGIGRWVRVANLARVRVVLGDSFLLTFTRGKPWHNKVDVV